MITSIVFPTTGDATEKSIVMIIVMRKIAELTTTNMMVINIKI